jgi:hypothetical protein
MPGGLMQLVGKGAQDQLILGNPSFTHFRSMYKRHTDFAMEHFRLYFKTSSISLPPSGTMNLQVKVERYAQLLHDCYLSVTLPDIYSPVVPITGIHSNINALSNAIGYEYQWVRNIGYNLINQISVTVNGQPIVTHTGEWMKLYSELKFDSNKKQVLNQMMGNIPELYDPANAFTRMNQYPHSITTTTGPGAPSIAGRTILIPLHFWFCESIGAALPLVALQLSEVHITVQLNNMYDIFTVRDVRESSPTFGKRIAPDVSSRYFAMTNFLSPPTRTLSPTIPSNTDLMTWNLNPFIEANYIWLGESEMNHIAKTEHSFIIRQVDRIEVTGQHGPSNDLELAMRNLCTRVVWVAQRDDRRKLNDYDNYTNWTDAYTPPLRSSGSFSTTGAIQQPNVALRDILIESNIILDGKERFNTKQTEFFSNLQNYKHSTGKSNTELYGIYSYSFALDHTDQPSGHINGSMFNKTILRNTYIQPNFLVGNPPTSTVACVLKSTAGSANPTIVPNPNAIDPRTRKPMYTPDDLITIVTKSTGQTLEYGYVVRAYVESYNFFRVLGGIGNVVFSS